MQSLARPIQLCTDVPDPFPTVTGLGKQAGVQAYNASCEPQDQFLCAFQVGVLTLKGMT